MTSHKRNLFNLPSITSPNTDRNIWLGCFVWTELHSVCLDERKSDGIPLDPSHVNSFAFRILVFDYGRAVVVLLERKGVLTKATTRGVLSIIPAVLSSQ